MPKWWRPVGWLQGVLALAVAAGAVWLLGLALLGWLRIEDVVPLPEVEGVPIPTWLVLGGAAAGLVLAFLAGSRTASARTGGPGGPAARCGSR